MATKGYPDLKALGVYVDGELLFYYFRLPEGVLEVELAPSEGRWQRRVTDFIMSDTELQEMLGEDPGDDCLGPSDTDAPFLRA